MKPQKPGNSSGPGPEVVKRIESKRRIESVAGQCRMRYVLGRVSAGAAGRILNCLAASFPGRNKCLGTHCNVVE